MNIAGVLMSTDVQMMLLVLTNTVLGVTQTIEGLAALGVVPPMPEMHMRRLKAGVRVACGILQLANVILIARGR